MPHRGEQDADPDVLAAHLRRGLPRLESEQDLFHHLVEGQPLFEVLLRGEPDLGVDHAVGGEVLGAFTGDAFEPCRCLHDGDGVGEHRWIC